MRNRLAATVAALALAAGAPLPERAGAALPQGGHKLLVVSIDGLDWRYLRDRDALKLRIPNLRRLLREGDVADGVTGVWPTVTWPSHTSMVTGVRVDQHGILSNARRGSAFTESYWSAHAIKVPTLWDCAGRAGLTTATVTWPSTLDAPVTWNLPEVAVRRNGGSMDLESVGGHATPGLVEAITQAFPSFPQQWVDDRTRTQAVVFLLREKRPDLLLAHLVDLDSDEHDRGPFGPEARATLERSDALIGEMLAALPAGYDVAVVSDHGFERIDRVANPLVAARAARVEGVRPLGGVVVADTPAAAGFLRARAAAGQDGLGREIPPSEVALFAPTLAGAHAVFEPAPHVTFGRAAEGDAFTQPPERGDHGFWPGRADYGSVYLAWGPGLKAQQEPRISMLSIHDRLAAVLGLRCQTG